jgi:arylamine N-acetyltransferase
MPPLSDTLADNILEFLGCPTGEPTVRRLNRLIHTYIRKVPWESVFRIVKRHTTAATAHCPRWPEEFWYDALTYGGGGTCFETNLAFFCLLRSLGYQGYLTINDMGDQRACHATIILIIQGRKYIVDGGIPIHRALPFDPNIVTRRYTAFHTYTVRPDGTNLYQVERSHHPKRNIYTLIDRPINDEAYQTAVEQDYEDTGYFLDRVIIVKVIDDKLWRFNSMEQPYTLEGFDRTGKQEFVLSPSTLVRCLAEHFSMPEERIAAALAWTQKA